MEEKYRARNNNDNVENLENVPQKTKKEERQESSAKVAKVAAKAAAEYFAPGVGGKAVDMVANTEAGQQVLDRAGKVLAKNPITGRMAKKLDDQGAVDLADKATDMISGKPETNAASNIGGKAASTDMISGKTGTNAASNIGGKAASTDMSNGVNNFNSKSTDTSFNKVNASKNGNKSKSEVDSSEQDRVAAEQSKDGSEWERIEKTNNIFAHQQFLKKKKLVIIAICGGFFFFILMMTMIVAAKDFGNLDLTNKAKTIIGTGGARSCTTEELESGLVYVGDSRTVGMESTLNNENINYIAGASQGYDWLKDTASLEIDNTIQNNPDSVVVLGLGVNDLYNADNYVAYYKDLMNKYPDNTFYVLSVNPVDDTLAASNGYNITNSEIDSFNNKLKSNFSDYYIDVNSTVTIGTSDGLHYDNDTNLNIHDSVLFSIKQSGEVMCGAAGDLSVSLETVAMWYIENVDTYQKSKSGKGTGSRKYYQTPFGSRKFGDDCTEFVTAYMSFISGVDLPESYSGGMIDPNGDWANKVYSAGWEAYSSDEIDSLQFGDVLIAHSGSLYSTKGHHAEIYINENQTFGWGSIKKTYPTSNTITRSVEGSHVHFRDANHDYITIYRYIGA